MSTSKTTSVITSKPANIGTKLWMVGSFIVELSMTIITWAVIPLFFKFWSVICLMIDMFMILREFVLHPVINKYKTIY